MHTRKSAEGLETSASHRSVWQEGLSAHKQTAADVFSIRKRDWEEFKGQMRRRKKGSSVGVYRGFNSSPVAEQCRVGGTCLKTLELKETKETKSCLSGSLDDGLHPQFWGRALQLKPQTASASNSSRDSASLSQQTNCHVWSNRFWKWPLQQHPGFTPESQAVFFNSRKLMMQYWTLQSHSKSVFMNVSRNKRLNLALSLILCVQYFYHRHSTRGLFAFLTCNTASKSWTVPLTRRAL